MSFSDCCNDTEEKLWKEFNLILGKRDEQIKILKGALIIFSEQEEDYFEGDICSSKPTPYALIAREALAKLKEMENENQL